jgi:hypothetical protein
MLAAVRRRATGSAVAGLLAIAWRGTGLVAGRTLWLRLIAAGRVSAWWRVVVGWPVGLTGACWRGDRGQGAQQQAQVDVGAEQVGAAARSRGLQSPGQGGDPGHRRRRMRSRQARPGQRRGPVIIGIQADPRPPLRRLPAILGALGVGDDHRLTQPGAELGVGEFPGTGQDIVLNTAGGVLSQEAGGLGDQPRPVGIDLPRRQGPV